MARDQDLLEVVTISKILLGVYNKQSYFQIGPKIFRQTIGIPMRSDPLQFFADAFLFFYKSKCLKSILNTNCGVARKFSHVFRFINDLITVNDGNEFENHYNENYPPGLILKKEST